MNATIVESIYESVFLNLGHSNTDLFLCGGASSKEKTSKRDELRKCLEKNSSISIFYPEDMFMELLGRKKYDLLTLESFLADNSDWIFIVCESPGSFAELGAFVNNERTVDKVIVLLHTKYKNAKSFISQGPIQYVKSRNKEHVIYFNNDIDDLIYQINMFLNKKEKIYRTSQKLIGSQVKNVNLISGQYCFIVLLLYFYKNIEVSKLVKAIQQIYEKQSYEKQEFGLLFTAATRRLYKEGLLIKSSNDMSGVDCYELTTKGYTFSKELVEASRASNRAINNIRLKILREQYY